MLPYLGPELVNALFNWTRRVSRSSEEDERKVHLNSEQRVNKTVSNHENAQIAGEPT